MSQPPSTNSNQASNDPKNPSEFYLPPNKTGKKTLVLDLDETLVHSQFGPFDIPSDVVINIEIENEIHDIHVLVRPGVKEFLEKLSKRFEIIIFTASISKYAGPLLDILDKNKLCTYRLFREHCTLINTSFVKDLKKLGRDLKDVIIVDNSPMAYLLNSDNGLPILTWFEDKSDRELYKICPILEFLSLVPDVRDYICKIVVNNEISYNNAMNVINDYNEMLRKKQNETNDEKDSNIIENNNEISDSSERNLVFIDKGKRQQQININIINNNITNYIYDNNKNQDKKENINNNYSSNINNNINVNSQNKNEKIKNKFNPNNIIASVNKPTNPPNISSPGLSSLNNQKQNKNKNTISMKNLNNKEKPSKNNSNIKISQHNTNYIHKKSGSTGINHKNKTKKNFGEILNMNNCLNNNIKINLNKNATFRNNTNYNSKSYNKKEIKINENNVNDNKITKSAKNIKKTEKIRNNSSKNIAVNKKSYNKNKNNIFEKSQIRLYHEGNLTTVHKKQKSLINFNILNDKNYRNNNSKKNKQNATNLLHSVDLTKNDVATYYHNSNFPFFKQNNFNLSNNNINKGGITTKNKNNNFLKTGKISNKKINNSSSLENLHNKINSKNNKSRKKQSNININGNNFNYIQKKNNEKKFLISHTLNQKEKNLKKDKNTLNSNINNDIVNDKDNINMDLLNEKTKNNNSAMNIKNIKSKPNSNIQINELAHSYQINQRSESMQNLIANNSEELKFSDKLKNMNKSKKKDKNNSANQRPKSSNILKYSKGENLKTGISSIKRDKSGKYGKTLRYDISEILERRGIAISNRTKEYKNNLNNNFISNNSNNNSISIRNKSKSNNINKINENIIRIKAKDN